jgi:putative DNA primase/helicase
MFKDDPKRAVDALYCIPANLPRLQWVKVAFAFHAAGGRFDDFDKWSAQDEGYNAPKTKATWKSSKAGGGITEKSLFFIAREHGYKDSIQSRPQVSPQVDFSALIKKKPAIPQPQKAPTFDPALDPALIWERCIPATTGHAYIVQKQSVEAPLGGLRVVPEGDPLRQMGESMAGALVVPVIRLDGVISSLQFITAGEVAKRLKANDKPTKLNLRGASMEGWFTVGEMSPGGMVYVCEGIGTAWAAWKATGSAAVVCFGAGNMERVASALRQQDSSARLVVCPDVGQEDKAISIAATVDGAVAAMPEGWPKNSDLNDLGQSEGFDLVASVLENAQKPPKPEPRYKLLTCAQLRDLPPLAWCVRGVLPARGLAAIAGPSASGKSFLAFDLAAAIALGVRWFGQRVAAAPVVYAALEGEAGFKLRAQAWETSHGQALPDGLRLMLDPFKLTEAQDVQDLATVVPAGAVVVVDTLNRAAPDTDENSSRDMGKVLEAAKQLQALTDGLVLLVHHTGKDESRGLRGHSSLFAALDAVVTVSRDGDRREWRLGKSKDGADGDAHTFKLQVEMLGVDEHGDSLTSCVVVPTNEPPKEPKGKRMGECEGAVLEFLASKRGGVRKSDVTKHFEGRYQRSNVYRAVRSLITAQAVHEAAGMVAAASAAR